MNEVLTSSKVEQICMWKDYYKELLSVKDRETETHQLEHAHLNVTFPKSP